MKIRFFSIIFLLSFFSTGLVYSADDNIFTAAGIQFEIRDEVYQSEDSFFSAVEEAVIKALEADYRPDIIVFPEYIGVFYQLIAFNEIVAECGSFQEALVRVLDSNPGFSSMADLFIKTEAWKSYFDGWSRIAADYELSIVAGSCFIPDEKLNLYNRTFVYGPDGGLVYTQNKVFLTEFESEIIGLTAGNLESAGLFEVGGQNVALTICKDAYFPQWEQKHSGAFIWIDIKANGESFNNEQQRSFMRALPQRLMQSDVPFGMTVCAVGSYLDLFWEGQSSAIYKSNGKLALADIAGSFDAADNITISISTEQ